MKKLQLIKLIFFTTIFLSFAPSIDAQVGINTDNPSATLDVNGDLRIRQTDISTSTDDYNLVIDANGIIKRSLVTNSLFRGFLATDFITDTGNTSLIYKIDNFTVIDEPNDDFDDANSFFIPSVTGLYNIIMTVTTTQIETITRNNIVYGLVDNSTAKWVMRFSVPRAYIEPLGTNSTAGVTNSFSGAVMLTKGEKYYFGVTGSVKLLSNPTGNTGEGIGTYFSVELLKTY